MPDAFRFCRGFAEFIIISYTNTAALLKATEPLEVLLLMILLNQWMINICTGMDVCIIKCVSQIS